MVCFTAMGYFEDIQRLVRKIPRGKVATYGSVARAAGYPGTARQVAWALHASESKRIPWQRVLGAQGKILLPDEAGLQQRTLLELEGIRFKGSRVDMKRFEFRFGTPVAKSDSRRNRKTSDRRSTSGL